MVDVKVVGLSASKINDLLNKKKAVDAFFRAVEKYAFNEVSEGDMKLKDWRIGSSLGHRFWVDKEEVQRKFKHLKDEIFNIDLKSPAQLERIAGKANIEPLTDRKARPVLERKSEAAKRFL